MYLIDQLVKMTDQNSPLANYNFIVVPVANPDGYEHTWTGDRLWRKNRSSCNASEVQEEEADDILGCGVDLNRNFPEAHWAFRGRVDRGEFGREELDEEGVKPASPRYRGPWPGSELETQAIIKHFKRHAGDIVLALDVHTYTQLIMYPWGWTKKHCRDFDRHAKIAQAMADNIQGAQYTQHQISSLYIAAGTATDWFYQEQPGIYSLAIELRPKASFPFDSINDNMIDNDGDGDNDVFTVGFSLHPKRIVELGRDLVEALEGAAAYLMQQHELEEDGVIPQ